MVWESLEAIANGMGAGFLNLPKRYLIPVKQQVQKVSPRRVLLIKNTSFQTKQPQEQEESRASNY